MADAAQVGKWVVLRQPGQVEHVGLDLRLGDLGRGRRVLVRALVAPRPKFARGLLGLCRPAKEQVQKILEDGHWARCRAQHTRFHLGVPPARPGAQQHQLAHQVGVAPGQVQRLEATEREAQHIHLAQAQGPDHRRRIVGHVFDPGARRAGGRRNTATVEQDHFAPGGQAVGHQWVPVVHPPTEMLQEEQGWLVGGGVAPSAVGKPVAIEFHPVGGGCEVGVGHADLLLLSQLQRARNSSVLRTKSVWNWKAPPCPASG